MGKYFLWGTVGFVIIIVGMLIYPTIHLNYTSIDVTGWIDLNKAGMVVLSYAFIPFAVYLIWKHIK